MGKPLQKSKKTVLSSVAKWIASNLLFTFLIVAFTLGIMFRFWELGKKIYSHDEVYTSLRAAGYLDVEIYMNLWDSRILNTTDIQKFLRPAQDKTIFDTLSIIARYEPHEAPLFFLMAHFWMRVVGYTPTAMRALPLFFSLLCIPGMYCFSMELFQSRPPALLSTILITISPFHILFAQDVRPFSLLALVTLLSSAALLRAMQRDTKLDWAIYSFSVIIGMYSQQLFALVALIQGLYFISMRTTHWKKQYAGFLSAAILALFAYAPWLYQLILRWDSVAKRMDWVNIQLPWYRYIQRWVLNFTSPFIDLDFGSVNLIPYILRAPVVVLIAGAFLYLVLHTPRKIWSFVLLLVLVPSAALILPDILLGGIRSIGGRYFTSVSIATILAVAYFLSMKLTHPRSTSQLNWRLVTILLLAGGIVSGLNIIQAETWWNKELSRIQPDIYHVLNESDKPLLIVSGFSPTNLGDVISLSLKLNPGVQVRIYESPDDVEFSGSYTDIFWFPSSTAEVQEISREKGLKVSEVVQYTLWRIDNQNE